MADNGATATSDLIHGIVRGEVPRQVRLFAAQGLLPVSREDLLSLQTVLTSDPDTELAEVAASSLRGEDVETILTWLRGSPPDPLVLDHLIRVLDDEAVWAAVASHPNVSNETLRVLARNATHVVQDIIITNQMRLFSCLEILDDLRANPQAHQVILRRVREFEEEFIEKVLAEEEEALEATGRSIEEAIDSLHAIGAHIPNEDTMPYPESEDPALVDAINRAGQAVRPFPPPQDERPPENHLRFERNEGGAGHPHQQPQPAASAFGAFQPQTHRPRSGTIRRLA